MKQRGPALKTILMAAAIAALGIVAQPAAARVLYDDGAPNAERAGVLISYGAVSDSFTLTQSSTLTGVKLWVWNFPGDTTSSVDWGITPNADDFSDTASVTPTSTFFTTKNGYDVNELDFSLPDVHLGTGVYYLALQNALANNGDEVSWDANAGPSDAWWSQSGNISSFGLSGSFQILGVVPEPATWAMMLVGFGGLGAAMRSRRRLAAA